MTDVLPTVVVISASIGAGHDGAARELTRRFVKGGYQVRRYDFLDLLPGPIGGWLKRLYMQQLLRAPRTWGWLLSGLEAQGWLSWLTCWLMGCASRRVLRAIGDDAVAVVSTYPLASQVLGRLRRRSRLAVPVATFLTDMSVHRLWVADGVDEHWALHDVAATEAGLLGAANVAVVGPAVCPRFRPARPPLERRRARELFGLPATGPLVLVVAGSWGVGDVLQTARDIAGTGMATPVLLCGENDRLKRLWEADGRGIALGWVCDMPALLSAIDLVVQNAGGLTSLECRTAATTVVTYRALPGHGLKNAAALHQAGWVEWIQNADELARRLEEMFGAEAPAAAVAA